MPRKSLIKELNMILELADADEIRCRINGINLDELALPKSELQYLSGEFSQITAARTTERSRYYIKRLIRSMCEEKFTEVNDLNLRRWKEYDDILTDSLWLIEKRDKSGSHNAGYWGNFIPQIPNQLIRRYTKKNEFVLDTFLGSGTTLIECMHLKRKGVGIELQEEIADLARRNIESDSSFGDQDINIVIGDSSSLDFRELLNEMNIASVQFAFLHPPYWDIIKFSDDERDLSNAADINDFLAKMGRIADNVYQVLDENRYMALVIGDKFAGGELIPLGFLLMQEVLKRKFKLKSIIVKNFEQTKGKQSQKELWRYRALKGGFYVFKHEYIFLFRKFK